MRNSTRKIGMRTIIATQHYKHGNDLIFIVADSEDLYKIVEPVCSLDGVVGISACHGEDGFEMYVEVSKDKEVEATAWLIDRIGIYERKQNEHWAKAESYAIDAQRDAGFYNE